MSTSKICSSCWEHFDFARPDLVAGIQKLKRQAVEDATRDDYSIVDIHKLQGDLQRYEKTAALDDGDGAPCPWNQSHPVQTAFPMQSMLAIWDLESRSRPIAHLRDSANLLDCQLCESLLSMIQYVYGSQVPDSLLVTSVWILKKGSTVPSMLQFRVYPDETYSHPSIIPFFFCSIEGLENEDLALDDSGTLDSSEHGNNDLQFFLRSFETCIKDHVACALGGTNSWTPTRLLDVQPGGSAQNCIVLVERADVEATVGGAKAQYLTLSHAWGSSIPLRLNKNNYLEMKLGLPIDTLPECYRDAVDITRKLRIRYLWIDSLCIFQDSIEDWEREALTMDRVYSNGICNIAACDTHDSNGSIMPSDKSQYRPALRIRSQFADGTATFNIIPDWVRLMRSHAPLYKRGWAVQERFLSRRLMHFSKFPVWECHKALVTPTYRQEITLQPDYADFLGSERGWLSTHIEDTHLLLARWFRLVEIYSRCKLTCPNDKLIALSGLAKSFSKLLKEDYYVGIWGGNHLIPCLLWASVEQSSPRLRSNDLAPSWSWACIDGEVQMNHKSPHTVQVFIGDISVRISPKDRDVFGRVTAGELRLKGRLFEIRDISLRLKHLKWGGQCWLDHGPQTNTDEKTYFLPLAKTVDPQPFLTFKGLFLQHSDVPSDAKEPRFQRIGMGTIGEVREVVDGSTLCNMLDDISWESLLLMSRSQMDEDMQMIVIV